MSSRRHTRALPFAARRSKRPPAPLLSCTWQRPARRADLVVVFYFFEPQAHKQSVRALPVHFVRAGSFAAAAAPVVAQGRGTGASCWEQLRRLTCSLAHLSASLFLAQTAADNFRLGLRVLREPVVACVSNLCALRSLARSESIRIDIGSFARFLVFWLAGKDS